MTDELHPSVRRILEKHGVDTFATLASDLSTADLSSLLLAVASTRAEHRDANEVFAQYQRDRFVAPATASPAALREVAIVATRVAGSFDEVELAPLAPFGTHSVLGGISQNRVVTTTRFTEAAADPTNTLALEAAVRRRDAVDDVRLCAVQRVTRAQLSDGPLTFAHFTLFGMVTAGRDRGNHSFEVGELVSHINHHCALIAALGLGPARVAVSDLSGRQQQPIDAAIEILTGNDIAAESWPERQAGVDYYPSLCFKVYATGAEGIETEVADGGVTNWTQALLQNRKERLVTSGVGLDRLALISPQIAS